MALSNFETSFYIRFLQDPDPGSSETDSPSDPIEIEELPRLANGPEGTLTEEEQGVSNEGQEDAIDAMNKALGR